MNPMRIATQSNKVSWTVAAATGLEWAKKVFRNEAAREEAVDLLWDQIFQNCRVYWKIQSRLGKSMPVFTKEAGGMLNKDNFPGSSLHSIGHRFDSWLAEEPCLEVCWNLMCPRRNFLPNMPTEEVFTLLTSVVSEGYATSTKTASYLETSSKHQR